MKVRVTEQCYLQGVGLFQPGAVIEYRGKPKRYLVPLDEAPAELTLEPAEEKPRRRRKAAEE